MGPVGPVGPVGPIPWGALKGPYGHQGLNPFLKMGLLGGSPYIAEFLVVFFIGLIAFSGAASSGSHFLT